MANTSNTELEKGNREQAAGDPGQEAEEICPICKGLGFLRANVPVNHPDFGQLVPCTCRLSRLAERRVAELRTLGDLEVMSRMTFETFAPEGHGLPPDKRANLRWAYE